MDSFDPNQWKTADIAKVEAQLEEQEYALSAEIERSTAMLDELDRQTPEVKDQEVEEFKEAVTKGPMASREWRVIAQRIERGEFTWRDILDGKMDSDPDMNAAMQSTRRAAEDAEFNGGDGVQSPEDGQQATDDTNVQRRNRAPVYDDEDEYFMGSIFDPGRQKP